MSGLHVPDATLAAFAAGDIDETAAVEVARHLDGCSRCATRCSALDPLQPLYAASEDPPVPSDLAQDIVAAWAAPHPRAPEPAIAAGLLALSLVVALLAAGPTEGALALITAIRAALTALSALASPALLPLPLVTVTLAIALASCTLYPRSLELHRRSA